MSKQLTFECLRDLFKRVEQLEAIVDIESEHCDAELHLRDDIKLQDEQKAEE